MEEKVKFLSIWMVKGGCAGGAFRRILSPSFQCLCLEEFVVIFPVSLWISMSSTQGVVHHIILNMSSLSDFCPDSFQFQLIEELWVSKCSWQRAGGAPWAGLGWGMFWGTSPACRDTPPRAAAAFFHNFPVFYV